MKRKHTIQILSATDRLVPRVALEKEALERAGYVTSVLYRSRIFWSTKTFRQLASYYVKVLRECLGKNVWAVHLTHIGQLPLSPILKLKQRVVVYDAYERYSVDISEQHFRGCLKKPAKWVIEVFENLIVRFFVDAVFVVSTPNEYLLKRYGKYCNVVKCVYNVPALTSVFKGDLIRKFSGDKLKIAYIGGIRREKGSDKFLLLARTLRDRKVSFELHVIGSFASENEHQFFLTSIERFQLSQLVFLHGYMEYPSMIRFLHSCHVGLNLAAGTSRFALIGIGSSRKNYTYMSSGMVVVTADVGQLAYLTQKERCGVVLNAVDDVDSLASVIQGLAKNPSKAITFAENGISTIKKWYNWENEQDKVIGVYDQLLWKSVHGRAEGLSMYEILGHAPCPKR